jgi:predicted alpha-1,2-mannosidase
MGADFKVHHGADYNTLTTWSLWDTYRAAHPLATIIMPDRMRDYAKTMLAIYREWGELPVWHLVSNDTYCMVGEPAVPVLADIILKGEAGDIDIDEAYEAVCASMLPTEYAKVRRVPLRGKDYLAELGYLPYDGRESEVIGKSMEYYIASWAAAQLAGKLGHKEDSVRFYEISMNYKRLYDRRVNVMRALDMKGEFRPLPPNFNPNRQSRDYTEGNPWQYTFLVPHDVKGLAEVMGGDKALEKRLDDLLAASSDLGEGAAPDISGLIGQYAHGNEPSHHILYMYNYVGQPWKGAKLQRQTMNELYFNDYDGLSGNEDVGQMSAWYILSSMGLYQVEPAGGKYIIGSPLFKGASINVGGGKTFTVRALDNSAENIYVQSARLNGKPYTRSYIMFQDIVRGGTLELQMGPKPSAWGTKAKDRP